MVIVFPDASLADDSGLLAAGGNLAPETLLSAYRSGIFPWYQRTGEYLWWSPDPRMVLFPDEFHCSRRLARRLQQKRFRISENQAFADVMWDCAKREEGTWILPEMVDAYSRLFELGHAQSVEVWEGDELVGGLYGVQLGHAFFAESMFSRRTDASKVALAHLAEKARHEEWLFIDCQFHTDHLASLGAREIPRADFLRLLESALNPA
ncbi:MAG TPA: leucyl/phenylalanyl-tRNA--protein transferase [Mariprofundaceae bacterium]|nr:leucyl/phenylalanyl-tRNA--protein transferase [Mariprofundaceae bacterium]